VASHKVKTSLAPHRLQLSDGCDGIRPEAGKKDVLFVYAALVDENDTLVPTASNPVMFELSGPGRLIGQNPIHAEAGIASILVETQGEEGIVEIGAMSLGLSSTKKIQIKIERP
jgi:beta-galactosidase